MQESNKILSPETSAADTHPQKEFFIERLPYFLLLGLIFFLPLVFPPFSSLPFFFVKSVFITLIVTLSLAIFLISKVRHGVLDLDLNWTMFAGFFLLLISLISALVNSPVSLSLGGRGFEVSTVHFIALSVFLMSLVSVFFISAQRIFFAYIGFFFSFLLLSLFHLVRLFAGPDFLSFGVFNGVSLNTVGSWNDLGIFFGLAALLSFVTLESIALTKGLRWLVYAALILSLGLVAIINFSYIWFVLGIFALVFLAYSISTHKLFTLSDTAGKLRKFPFIAFAIVLISIVFIVWNAPIKEYVSTRLDVAVIEAHPSWSSTVDLAQASLKKNFLLGVGPNRYGFEWLLNKDRGINIDTFFWNTDFDFGAGYIPSSLVSTGFLGFLAWLIFLGLFIASGIKSIFSPVRERFLRYLTVSSFLGALYLWIFAFIYVPSLTIITLAFFFTGLYCAGVTVEGNIKSKRFALFERPWQSFAAVLCLIVVLLAVLGWGYYGVKKFAAAVYFQKSILSARLNGDMLQAETHLARAMRFAPDDSHYRFSAALKLEELARLANQQDTSPDVLRAQFEATLRSAIEAVDKAVAFDNQNYQNWIMAGQVYEFILPIEGLSAGAYQNASFAYAKAGELNPQAPLVSLYRARLEASRGAYEEAKKFILEAVEKKPNFVDAFYLLSQIHVAEGKIKDAIASVEAASTLTPNDPNIYFQLGLLRYNDKNYRGAASAFEQAVVLNPVYANARYFLGLSYEKFGQDNAAIAEFEEIKKTNPDNAEVVLILANLKAGRSPFSNAQPPIDDKPENRKKLPVSEP